MIDTRSFEVSAWDWFLAAYLQHHPSSILDQVTHLSLSPAWQCCVVVNVFRHSVPSSDLG